MKDTIVIKSLRLLCLLCLVPLWAFAQKVSITGVVKDAAGESIIGASVIEKGTTNGTITDFDGNFTLQVENDAVLSISFVGYQPQDVPVAGKSMINVILKEDTEVLDEVVVVGYGVQKKKLVTGATVQVKGDDLQKLNTVSALGALQSQSPGVNITQSSGMPGEGPAAVLIKKACNIEKGSGVPNKDKVATISKEDVRKIAETKMRDLNAATIEAAMSMIAGTARSMGIVVGE